MIFFKWKTGLIIIPLLVSLSSILLVKNKNLHPFYVSVTEINQNDKDKNAEVSCKIFSDDFEKTLRQNYNVHVDLLNPVDKKKMDDLVFDYIKNHLQITMNNELLALQFVGYEKDEEAVWIYCEAKNVYAVKNVEINDRLLYEYKKEQINLLHVIINGVRRSTELKNPESKVHFDF